MAAEPLFTTCGDVPDRWPQYAVVCQLPAEHDGSHRCSSWAGGDFEWSQLTEGGE